MELRAVRADISIHPPHAGRDLEAFDAEPEKPLFQSTRPMRGGTHLLHPELAEAIYFNPPAPCGAGLENFLGLGTLIIFQSTRPMRGGTRARAAPLICSKNFNPPAPCGAGRSRYPFFSSLSNFNPPAPCGAGQQSCTKFTPCILAQYTIQRAAKLLFAYQQAYFC